MKTGLWMLILACLMICSACYEETKSGHYTPPPLPDNIILPPLPGSSSSSGSSGQSCGKNQVRCDDVCVDTQSSVSHCGKCGNACNKGEMCVKGKCTAKCTVNQCGDTCVDLSSDAANCGMCNVQCGKNMACIDSKCACADGYFDCDGNSRNGCESNRKCGCLLDTVYPCYYGPDDTAKYGECQKGVMECIILNNNVVLTACEGSRTPKNVSVCTEKDYNCNGLPDGHEDADNDGFSICEGDCCENESQCNSANPNLINPGKKEVPGNGIDDNCNHQIDETTE